MFGGKSFNEKVIEQKGRSYDSDTRALEDEIKKLRAALGRAREKLILYREDSNGEYQGGMEYGALIRFIDEALNQ